MTTILDYLATEFATFDEKPFNPVDSLILSQCAMVQFNDIAPSLKEKSLFANIGTIVENLLTPPGNGVHFRDALRAERYGDMFTGLVPEKIKAVLIATAASPRFRDMVICDYLSLFDTQRQTQFAAMTFVHKRDFAYIGFRGTDSSFVGWKEDFNMAFTSPVPAQEQAWRYVEAVANHVPKQLFLGGHSKGGNLAVFAAVKASPQIQARIERIYNHDGPGFRLAAFTDEEYSLVKERIHKTVPTDSIVGMLMESRKDYRVIETAEKGILAHDSFTWNIEGVDFQYADDLSSNAKFTDQVLSEWLEMVPDDTLSVIVDALFEAIEASGAEDAGAILSGGPKTIALLLEASKKTKDPARSILTGAIASLSDIAMRKFGEDITTLLSPRTKPPLLSLTEKMLKPRSLS